MLLIIEIVEVINSLIFSSHDKWENHINLNDLSLINFTINLCCEHFSWCSIFGKTEHKLHRLKLVADMSGTHSYFKAIWKQCLVFLMASQGLSLFSKRWKFGLFIYALFYIDPHTHLFESN
ncbi:hypothetical protein ACJX0J_008737 [Zea mays]